MFVLQLEAMRQLTLHTAWTMDRFGNKVRSLLLFCCFFDSFVYSDFSRHDCVYKNCSTANGNSVCNNLGHVAVS